MAVTDASFRDILHEAKDLVLAVDYNFYGDRMVTASSDHHLRVWDKKKDTWALTDTWRGHDAEVVDVSDFYKTLSIQKATLHAQK